MTGIGDVWTRGEGMHILLVEDDVRLARSYQRHLERAAHRVTLCHDAETAWTLLQGPAKAVNVIILDVLLPGRSGVELCRAVRRAGITTPILLLTALGQT